MAVVRETVVFDRVFDVQRRESTRWNRRRTEFSFEHAGRKVFGVSVPGWPELVQGHRITAVLAEPGNWQTLLGWKNHNTGELWLPEAPPAWDGAVSALLLGWLAYALVTNVSTPQGRIWALAAGTGLAGSCAVLIGTGQRERRRRRAVMQALSSTD
jgi:hypothetical protein